MLKHQVPHLQTTMQTSLVTVKDIYLRLSIMIEGQGNNASFVMNPILLVIDVLEEIVVPKS